MDILEDTYMCCDWYVETVSVKEFDNYLTVLKYLIYKKQE